MQGPIAQAHFAETAVDPEAGGGARKSPSDVPWINDWACVSGSAFLQPILEGLFGIRAPVFGQLTATAALFRIRSGRGAARAELSGTAISQ